MWKSTHLYETIHKKFQVIFTFYIPAHFLKTNLKIIVSYFSNTEVCSMK